MALFDDQVTIVPPPRRRMSRTTAAGIWALLVALVVLLVLSFLPSAYVIQRPGPVFNTLGTAQAADGTKVPLISIKGAKTYPTSGTLDLLTVQVVGSPDRTPNWAELAAAWFDRSKAIVPLEAVFPQGQTTEQQNQESAAMMVDSQKEATAAALLHLGYHVPAKIVVVSALKGSPADGVLKADDVILAADGTPVTDADALRAVIQSGAGAAVQLRIQRAGAEQTVSISPEHATLADGSRQWIVGVNLTIDYDFPIDVTIQLNNVGGPSAGMMFALGIIDTLTPGSLNGGRNVAGTGTITADGTVGAIGGIRQKMYGAADAGAKYFLAPQSNCNEVTGHIPAGLRVFSVSTLDDALGDLKAIARGSGLDALRTCPAT